MTPPDFRHPVTIRLARSDFRPECRQLLVYRSFRVETFAYPNPNAIEALRITTDLGSLTVLPFMGQQVWDARFHGRRLTMRSMFDDPVATADYLSNNGAYLVHCGGSAMGNPGPADTHPLHGELPNARLDGAALRVYPPTGSEPAALTVVGWLTHRIAFRSHFTAELALTVTEGSGLMDSVVRITNRSGESRPLMYLAHINFRPAAGGCLVEALKAGESLQTRGNVMVGGTNALRTLTAQDLDRDAHAYATLLEPACRVVPELVQTVPLQADDDGWVRSMQVHLNGAADLVEHCVRPLTHTVRWLRRSADEDAFGFALPATAEADGYTAETAKGHVTSYQPGDDLIARFRHGALAVGEQPPPRRRALTDQLPADSPTIGEP